MWPAWREGGREEGVSGTRMASPPRRALEISDVGELLYLDLRVSCFIAGCSGGRRAAGGGRTGGSHVGMGVEDPVKLK